MTPPANMAAISKLSVTNHPMGNSLKYSVHLELLAQLENVRSNGFNVFIILATVCQVSDYKLLGASSWFILPFFCENRK